MRHFENLSSSEYETLLKFPAYISLLAANADGKFDEAEETSAVEFAHVKGYSSDSRLVDFFKEVNQNFSITLNELNQALPLGKVNREATIKEKLADMELIIAKLHPDYTYLLHESMQSFKDHVSRAHHNVLIDFIFPMPIKGLSH